jgi:hypothetical protein
VLEQPTTGQHPWRQAIDAQPSIRKRTLATAPVLVPVAMQSRRTHHLRWPAEPYASGMKGDHLGGPTTPGRWWTRASVALALIALTVLALDVNEWTRLRSGSGGPPALAGGLFLAGSSVAYLRLAVSAFIHGRRGDPKPEAWHDAIFRVRKARKP